MTWAQKHKENKKLIGLYSDYLLSGEKMAPDDYLKLVNEIARLDTQTRQIEEMPYGKIKKEINQYTIER